MGLMEMKVLRTSPMPRRRAAWWKKAAQMHFLMTSQSVPLLTSSIFWFSMISFSWARTSRTFRIAYSFYFCFFFQIGTIRDGCPCLLPFLTGSLWPYIFFSVLLARTGNLVPSTASALQDGEGLQYFFRWSNVVVHFIAGGSERKFQKKELALSALTLDICTSHIFCRSSVSSNSCWAFLNLARLRAAPC